jgi:hypothetical protein
MVEEEKKRVERRRKEVFEHDGRVFTGDGRLSYVKERTADDGQRNNGERGRKGLNGKWMKEERENKEARPKFRP